jgi:hypothetical protein
MTSHFTLTASLSARNRRFTYKKRTTNKAATKAGVRDLRISILRQV